MKHAHRRYCLLCVMFLLTGCQERVAPQTPNPAQEPSPPATFAPTAEEQKGEKIWLTWDLSASNDAAALGTPDRKDAQHPSLDDPTQDWWWKGSGRIIIKLPLERVIDSHAENLQAKVLHGRVVGIVFGAYPPFMDAAEFRAAMVHNIEHLHLRKGADAADAVLTLDRWITRSEAGYVPHENFGSRDGEPNVDVSVGAVGMPEEMRRYSMTYSLFWFR